eukprot:snap_masked-scaffold_31-processed-gene-3.5-mRNA-1 protein AED:1.00 eAED:1.00 QI:0/0/0/0/1/1/4/0/107
MFTRVEIFFEVYKETKYFRVLPLVEFPPVQEKLSFLSSSCILSKTRLFIRSVKQGYRPIVGGKLINMMFSVEIDISSLLFKPLGSRNSSSATCCKTSFVIPSGPGTL